MAIADAVGMSIGFALALASIATVRELLGSGTWFGMTVLAESWWPRWGVMVLPPGAFLVLGVLLAVAEWMTSRRSSTEQQAG